MSESFAEFRRRAFFLAAMVLILLFVLHYASIVVLLFASVLLAAVLTGLAGWLSVRAGMKYGIALLLVVAGLSAAFAALAALIGLPFANQIEELGTSLSSAYQDFNQYLAESRFFQSIAGKLPQNMGQEWLGKILSGPIFGVFSGLLGAITSIVLILFISLYLAVGRRLYFRGMLYLFPKSHRPRFEETFEIIARSLRYWMAGRIMSMAVVGVLTGLGLWIAGIPLALSLAVIAALLAFVPVVGPIVSAVPGVVLGLSESLATGLIVLGVYTVVQVLESYLITPLIDKKVVALPPVLLLASQAVFGALVGISGIIFAAPITLVLIILIQRLYVQEELGYNVGTIGKDPVEPH